MAAVAGTLTTATLKGIREDLSDMIYNLSPEKTPFMSLAGRSKAKNTLHEWQTDSLANPDAANKRVEGNEASFAVPTATVRLGNYCQISDKTAIVSGTAEAVDKAGRDSEMGYQMSKRSAELKRDIETILVGANQAADGSDPRATASVLAFLKTNISKGAGGVDPVYTTLPNNARTDGTQRALTEQFLKDVIALAWASGGSPDVISVGAFNKGVISAFSGNADKVVQLNATGPGSIVAAMDIYVSDFGNLKVTANRFQRARDMFVFDPEYIKVAYLRGFSSKVLATTGDAQKRLINVEYSLEIGTELAHGAVYDLLTS